MCFSDEENDRGCSIVQLAKAFGAKAVIAIDISDEKLRSVRKLGATHVINGAKENVAEKVRVRA